VSAGGLRTLTTLSLGMIAGYAAGQFQGQILNRARRPPLYRSPTHKPPRMPLMIDGKEVPPESIRDFNGKSLYTVLDNDAQASRMLRAFTDQSGAMDYIRRLVSDSGSNWPQRPARVPFAQGAPGSGFVNLYEETDFGGCEWRLVEWNAPYPDFTKICGCGWFGTCVFGKNANDRVSSIDCYIASTQAYTSLVMLSEDINLGGSWTFLPGITQVADLGAFGWDDRASAMMIWYLAP
jgi:hypothetical protein